MIREKVTPVLVALLEADERSTKHSIIGETLSLVGGNLVVDSLKERVNDKSLNASARGRFQSALGLVERAERRRN